MTSLMMVLVFSLPPTVESIRKADIPSVTKLAEPERPMLM